MLASSMKVCLKEIYKNDEKLIDKFMKEKITILLSHISTDKMLASSMRVRLEEINKNDEKLIDKFMK